MGNPPFSGSAGLAIGEALEGGVDGGTAAGTPAPPPRGHTPHVRACFGSERLACPLPSLTLCRSVPGSSSTQASLYWPCLDGMPQDAAVAPGRDLWLEVGQAVHRGSVDCLGRGQASCPAAVEARPRLV